MQSSTQQLKAKKLICVECSESFNFTIKEQREFIAKGYANEPKRCPDDRKLKKATKNGDKMLFDAKCSVCGETCQVPFKPAPGRFIMCDEDFAKSRSKTTGLSTSL